MTTKYPNSIDGYSEIRVVRDSIEEIVARDHNDLRSAVVAIEQVLGTNPQGLYGSVSARLDDIIQAETNHIDSHRIVYTGSAPHTFVDGYALGEAQLHNTISEIVNILGSDTAPAGADRIGITPFTTPSSKYDFTENSISGQIVEAGNILDENATLLERALGAFVVDGMEVTESGGGDTADISSGHIVSDGRLLRYAGGSLSVDPAGTFYVFAYITGGVVYVDIEDALIPSLDPENPIVLLKKIVRTGGVWNAAESTDIRRYGLLINDKNFFSVGNAPSGGKDGYGCDFTSLKGAVDYVRALVNAGQVIAPMKIVLVDDIEISGSAGLNIYLDAAGLEIDGCGKSITVSGAVTDPLFWIENNRIRVHDLNLISNYAMGNYTFFAQVAGTTNVDDLHIVRCGVKTGIGGIPNIFFLALGEATGTYSVTNALISENFAEVILSGILYLSLGTYDQTLKTSRIINNYIIQGSFATSLFPGIQASNNCIISNNIITGGFSSGIKLQAPNQTKSSDNVILGTDYLDSYMAAGISVLCPIPNTDSILISDNMIKGITSYGINAFAGDAPPNSATISNNVIDNGEIITLHDTMIGINAGDSEIIISGNKIIWPGTYAIQGGNFITSNEIIGISSITSTLYGILCSSLSDSAIICDNYITALTCTNSVIFTNGSLHITITGNVIYNCTILGPALGSGISLLGSEQATVSDNIISNSVLSPGMAGITNIGSYSNICSNIVINQAIGAFAVNFGGVSEITFIGNQAYNCGGIGIDTEDSTNTIISENILFGSYEAGSQKGIYRAGRNSVISNNTILNYGHGGTLSENVGISLMDAYSGVISGNIIEAGPDLYRGIYLDANVSTLNNIIVDNMLYKLSYIGIDLNSGTSGLHLVSNNIIYGMNLSNFTAGIDNLSSQSIAVGNNIVYSNGSAIHVTAGVIGSIYSMGSSIVGNTINEPDAYGIFVDQVGGALRLDGYSDLNSCLISGNHILSSDDGYDGIYLEDSWRITINNNYIKNFNTGIHLLSVLQGCDNNLICGNNIQQDPGDNIGVAGILIDDNCFYNHINGNFIFGSFEGIKNYSNNISVTNNHINWARETGIDVSNTIDNCISGNTIGPGFPLSTSVNGIDLSGCEKTLVVGNLAFGYLDGYSFVITNPQPVNGIVAAGNLGREGAGIPSDGSGGTWNTGGYINTKDSSYIA